MRVLLVHERYQQRGGEDEVFDTESQLLRDHGHLVEEHVVSNHEIEGMNPVSLAAATIWNSAAMRRFESVMKAFRPEVTHFHNTFPLLSPGVYGVARKLGTPVVKTHHNYRLLCVNALLFREGRACEACVGSVLPWRGVKHGCYRKSRAASAVVAATVGVHRAIGTWQRSIDVHIALTDFARRKLVEAGVPERRIAIKPNFVHPDPGVGAGGGGYALFAGRLSEEKGVRTLLDAWKNVGSRLPLRIVGDGPLRELVDEAVRKTKGIEWLGTQSRACMNDLMRNAKFTVVPSSCFEGLSRVLIESYSAGTPVVASRLGSFETLVRPERTGLHFRVSTPEDLARVINNELDRVDGFARMRRTTRMEFERKYTAETNYRLLMDIYHRAGVPSGGSSLAGRPGE